MTSISSSTDVGSAPVATAPAGARRPPRPDGPGSGGAPVGGTPVDGPPTSGPTPAATALSDLLDTGHDDLLAELRGGSDLLEMLQDRGISRSQAFATVGEGSLVDTTA